jgi:hypothetical protein
MLLGLPMRSLHDGLHHSWTGVLEPEFTDRVIKIIDIVGHHFEPIQGVE